MKPRQLIKWLAGIGCAVLSSFGIASIALAADPAGTYTGTYSGSDYGAVTIVVDSHGSVACDFFSTPNNTHYRSAGGLTALSGYYSIECDPDPSTAYIWVALSTQMTPGVSISGIWDSTINTKTGNGSFTATYSSGGTGGGSTFNSAALSGLWYDPHYTGTGYNFLQTSVGLIVTYYGWDKSGARLWLTANGPTSITLGQPFTLTMNQTVGGTFAAPAKSATNQQWGTIALTFNTCTSATATLNGSDGTRTESLQLLIGPSGTPTCQ